jgi:hypothetical protein
MWSENGNTGQARTTCALCCQLPDLIDELGLERHSGRKDVRLGTHGPVRSRFRLSDRINAVDRAMNA